MATRREQSAFVEALLSDDDARHHDLARAVIDRDGCGDVLAGLFWPSLLQVDLLRREDALTEFTGRRAVRRIGSLARRSSRSPGRSHRGRLSALVICGGASEDEVQADVITTLLEASGVVTRLCGGGVPAGQILSELQSRPVDLLVIISIGPSEAPATRRLMDRVKAMDPSNRPRIVAGGGLFARAEGLALEMGADLELTDPRRLLEVFSAGDRPQWADRAHAA